MPIPATLGTFIKSMGDNFDPSAIRKEFTDNAAIWRLYLDLLEMDSTKLAGLIEKHADEGDAKFALRQGLAAIFNYVPLIIRMTVNYLHSEQPTISVEDDRLSAFLGDCNGAGLSFLDYVRKEALPLALTLGWVDVLVQNPATPEGMFETAADQAQSAEPLSPRVFTVTPLQRTNWAADQNHKYSWLRFRDYDNDNRNPFLTILPVPNETYVTISGFLKDDSSAPLVDDSGNEVGFWVRSYRDGTGKEKGWNHDGDWLPTRRCPFSTLYYQQSIDPDRRHFGVSKIAMIALLTKKIIQLLSWSDEQVLSNLAIFVFPGEQPKDNLGKPIPIRLSPFSVIWLGNDAKVDPRILQGTTGHIEVIWKIIDAYTREILRLAYLIGASAEPEQITSGVQGVVARTELFQELSDLAGALDRFALETLALVASLVNNADVTVDQLIAEFKPKIDYYKGNYAVDPLKDVIANSTALIDTFRDISPAMVESVYKQLAQTALYNEDSARDAIFEEIKNNFRAINANRATLQNAIVGTANVAAANAASNTTVATETGASGVTITPAAPVNPIGG